MRIQRSHEFLKRLLEETKGATVDELVDRANQMVTQYLPEKSAIAGAGNGIPPAFQPLLIVSQRLLAVLAVGHRRKM